MADWPPFSPNLNPLDFKTRHVLQAKAQATPHSNLTALRPSITAEFERKAAVCIRNTSDFAGKHVNADIYQELLRQHVVPWVQRDVAWRKIWFLVDWPLFTPNFISLDFSTGSVLRPKGQAMPHANLAALRPLVAAE